MSETSINGATSVEHQVLEIVGSLVAEIGGSGSPVTRVPTLYDALDRDWASAAWSEWNCCSGSSALSAFGCPTP